MHATLLTTRVTEGGEVGVATEDADVGDPALAPVDDAAPDHGDVGTGGREVSLVPAVLAVVTVGGLRVVDDTVVDGAVVVGVGVGPESEESGQGDRGDGASGRSPKK